jgi:hypothetical protein
LAIDFDGDRGEPSQIVWNKTITVPFSPETSLSGIGDTGLFRGCGIGGAFNSRSLTTRSCCCISARWIFAPQCGSTVP